MKKHLLEKIIAGPLLLLLGAVLLICLVSIIKSPKYEREDKILLTDSSKAVILYPKNFYGKYYIRNEKGFELSISEDIILNKIK